MRAGQPLPGCWRGSLPPCPKTPNPSTRSAPGREIGHVHLKVADLDRALDFYSGVLGFELMQRFGNEAAFVSAGGYHHHLGLNTWQSKGGSPPAPGTTGLFHTAILYPTRRELAEALRRVREAGIPLDGASDHGVSEALYLRDPDQNGVELYWDRPRGGVAARPERSGGRRDVHCAARPRRPAGRARRLDSAPCAAVAQLARASACHAEGRGFESHQPLHPGIPDRSRQNASPALREPFPAGSAAVVTIVITMVRTIQVLRNW